MSEPAQKIIEVNQISTLIGQKPLHQKLSLSIYEKEILAIVGGSGSGKSTLLRAILKLLPIVSGQIKVFGQDLYQVSPQAENEIRRNWGVMFQHGALFSSLTLLENVMFPLQEQTRLNLKSIEEIARLKIALAGLPSQAADKFPGELSGGMKKRAAIARAIALDPKIVFLDEPSAGLDPQGASALDELILSLNQNLGITIILVTHDLDTLWETTDRVAFLGQGKVLDVKPIEDLYNSDNTLIQDYFNNARAQHARRAEEPES